ncbi:MAG: transcriptional repressor LexA [Firmicutes bacterium]|nr:transcriptional repressor LexA [Bacillota bacterium]
MGGLTKRERQMLDYIKVHIQERGFPPSIREIGQAVGLKSSSSVHGYLVRLENKGLIRRDPAKPRTIEVCNLGDFAPGRIVQVPVVGKVTAGQPILAVEHIEEYFPLPAEVTQDADVFMLRVRGESMIEAGILEGDYVVVRKQNAADDGDIVVALLGDEATVKTFYLEEDGIRLQPANALMEPIYARDVQILGKVIGIFRKYPA